MIFCKKKVAVCILTYNRIKLLKKSIDSVLNSFSTDFQLFVFDNCSTDGTKDFLDILHEKKLLYTVSHNVNIEVGNNANFILDNLIAKYCIMLHDDDILEPQYIEEVLRIAESDDNIAIVGTGYNTIDENDKKTGEIIYKKFREPVIFTDRDYFYHQINGLSFPWSGTLINMKKVNNFRFDYSSHPICCDTIFISNIVVKNRVGYIPKLLMNYRISKYQATQSWNFEFLFKEWNYNFYFYKELIIKNNYGKDMLKNITKANTKTLLYLLTIAPDYKYYFKILNSEYFNFLSLNPKKYFIIIRKFFRLLLKNKQIE